MPEPDFSPKRSFVFIRGVGNAPMNASLIAALPQLAERNDVATAVEANWSFGSAPALQPTTERGHRGVWQTPFILEHFEHLARSWRGCTLDSYPRASALDRVGDRLIQLGTLSTASVGPFLVGLLPGLGWMSRAAVVWWGICVVSATLGAILRCPWVGVATAIRLWFFALTWPIMLVILLAGLASPVLSIGLPAGVIAFLALLRVPAPWIMRAQSGAQSPSIMWYFLLMLTILAVSVVVVISAWLVSVIARIFIAPLAKRAADIVRYRGNSEYRDHVHSDVRAVVCALDRSARLVLCGHSLGSVIAVDFIRRHHDLVEEFASVELVTGGSPLRRFMARFYSHAYPTPTKLLHTILGAHAGFRWVNVYRKWDPIGSILGLPAGLDRGADDQRWPPRLGLRAHAEFWGDPLVWNQATLGFERWDADPPSPQTPEPFVDSCRSLSPLYGRVIRSAAIGALLIAGVTGSHWMTFGETRQAIGHAELLSAEAETEVVRGQIHKYISGGARAGDAPEAAYILTYSANGADYKRRGWPLSSNRRWLDSEAKWIKSDPLAIGLAEGVDVHSAAIDIRYVKEQHSVWGVDGWPRGPMSAFEYIIATVMFAIFSVIAAAMILVAWDRVGSSFYGALIGDRCEKNAGCDSNPESR